MITRRIFADLDNTVIFSHRHEIGERVLVERLNGKEQAYMTKRGYELLQTVSPEEFVPVTSRTIEQYQRIRFYSDGNMPKYALIDNGGILLIDGVPDREWLGETKRMIAGDMQAVKRVEEFFSKDAHVKWQDDMVLFLKTQLPFNEVATEAEKLGLMVFNHLNKIYICSSKLSKGSAVKRFKERFTTDYSVVAGDSEVDVSMISEADKAYMALKLEGYEKYKDRVCYMNAVDISEKIFGR